MGLTSYLSLLITVTVLGQAYSSFVVLAPNKFHPGWDYNVQVIVNGMAPGTTTTVRGSILDAKDVEVSSVNAATIAISENGVPQKLTLKIPGSINQGGTYKLKVTGSGGMKFSETTEVRVDPLRFLTFIQTDKKIYKAGQLVRFRVITVNKDLVPQRKPLVATIKNPAGSVLTRIEIDGTKDVFTDSYQLTAFPELGEWTIRVVSEDNIIFEERQFTVDEYVLPKFEVNVQTTPESLFRFEEKNSMLQVIFDAKYTYGLDVFGDYEVTVTNSMHPDKPWKAQGEMTKSGDKMVVEVDLSKLEDWKRSKYFDVIVKVTDETQRSYQATAKVPVVEKAVKIKFDEGRTDMVFRPGMPIRAVVKITDNDGYPLKGMYLENPIKLKLIDWVSKQEILEEVTLSSGQVEVAWTPTKSANFTNSYDLTVSMKTPEETYEKSTTIKRYETLGNATLDLKWTTVDSSMLKMGFDMSFMVDVSDPTHFSSLSYMIVSRGNIQTFGKVEPGQAKTVKVTTDMCPNGKLVVYGVTAVSPVSPEPELIGDSLDLKLEHCQEKRVIPSVKMAREKTGTNTTINMTVAWTDSSKPADSIGVHEVHVLAVDKSIIMLDGSNDLTSEEVDKRLAEFKLEKAPTSGMDHHGPMFMRGDIREPFPPTNSGPSSTGELLKRLGLTVMADTVIKSPPEVPEILFRGGFGGGPVLANEFAFDAGAVNKVPMAAGGGKAPLAVVTVRKDFPDTWLWKSGQTDASGVLMMNEKTPDSITAWVISGFAVKDGSDMAVTTQPLELSVFNEFFVTLNLPYSIRRTEKFDLRATVFNYSPKKQNVIVTLAKNQSFYIMGEMTQSVQVEPNRADSVTFRIAANKVGAIKLEVTAYTEPNQDGPGSVTYRDTVIKFLPVKPEGVMRMRAETFPLFVPGEDEEPIDMNFFLSRPDVAIVEDSKRASVKITGNLMGNVMSNLDNLLQVPFGCGEQNMMSTIPNICAVEYLDAVDELTTEFNNKAMANVKMGYNKETQQYRFKQGGYSAFGQSDGNASTWLTAFVIRSFAQARKFYPTIVAKDVLEEDVNVLFSRQMGSKFVEYGKVIHKEMQGGGASGKALSVYVAVCLLEAKKYGIGMDQTKLDMAINMVDDVAEEKRQMNETFLAAITAYAVSLQDQPNKATVERLVGFVEEMGAPWNKTKQVPEGKKRMDMYVHNSGPSDIEITSYCLLAYCQIQEVAKGRKLALWLQSQQNGDGGFSSTQDTAVALLAISRYAALFTQGGPNQEAVVTVTPLDPPAAPQTVKINSVTARLLQTINLADETNEVNIKVTGTPATLAVVKVVWYFNTAPGEGEEIVINRPKPNQMTTEVVRMRAGVQKLTYCLQNKDLLYDKMMLMTLDLPSGMEVTQEEQKNMKERKDVKRVEFDDQKVFVYYEQEPTECMDVVMEETVQIEDAKEGNAVLSAYYDPGYKFEAPIPVAAAIRCTGDGCKGINTAPNQATISGLLMAVCMCFVFSLLVAV